MSFKAHLHLAITKILRHRFKILIVCSLILHGLLFILIQKWPETRSSLKSSTPLIEVTVINEDLPTLNSNLKTPQKSPKPKKSTKINFSGKTSAEIFEYKLKQQVVLSNNLEPANASDPAPTNQIEPYFKDNLYRPTENNYEAYGASGTYGYLENGGIHKILENTKFYEEIWKRVRLWTGFPKDFINFYLQGQVRIHALINHKGELIGDFTSVSSENPLLELYSMAILSVALAKPLHPSHWVKDKQIPVVFDFDFKFVYTATEEVLYKDQNGSYAGNTFKFITTRFVKPEIIQAIEDFFHDFYPPVMLLPGGVVMIDPILLYQKYQHWSKHGLKRISKVRDKEQKNLRKEILASLKNPKEQYLNVLNQGSLKDRNSDILTEKPVFRSTLENLTTDPINSR